MCPLMTVIAILLFLGCAALLTADFALSALLNEGRASRVLKSLRDAYRIFVDRLWELERRFPGMIRLPLVVLYPWLLFQYRPEVPRPPVKPIGESLRPALPPAPTDGVGRRV